MSGDDQKLMSDPKYKQFIQQIDKALKIFESSSEWADLISCLGKLSKVIQTYSQFSVLPRKLLIGKRLAQCLHPALPSGVHLKALECYNLILTQIGTGRLAQDLFIYSVGLFPLLSQASIAVRPILLNLYETHFLPLKKKLYPGLSGFLVALLPGIEEGSEFTERTTSILQKLCDSISEEIFFTCLWDTVLHSSMTRLSALLFAIGYIAKKPGQFKNSIVGKEVSLMVNALCASLDDSNVLVQRITLDFVISFFHFHSSVLSEKHVVKLLTYALGVLLRRDMSLNRRIFQWFLNVNSDGNPIHKMETTDDESESDTSGSREEKSYFDIYVHEPLTIAIIILFQNILESLEGAFEADSLTSKHRQTHLKPFRILITLLDKPEVGSAILNEIMLEIFRTLYKHSQVRSKLVDISIRIGKDVNSMHNELIKNANLLFSSLESYYIWEYLSKVLRRCVIVDKDAEHNKTLKACTNGFSSLIDIKLPTHLETFQIISYLLDVVSLETSLETQSEHWPNLLRTVIKELIKNSSKLDLKTMSEGISLVSKLFSRLSPIFNQPEMPTFTSTVLQQSPSKDGSLSPTLDTSATSFFEKGGISSCTDLSKTLFCQFVKETIFKNNLNARLLLEDSAGELDFNTLINQSSSNNELVEKGLGSKVAETFQVFCQYLVKVSCFPLSSTPLQGEEENNSIPDWLLALLACCCFNDCFDIQSSALSTVLDLVNVTLTTSQTKKTESYSKITPLISPSNLEWIQKSNLFKVIANNLWSRLLPNRCQHQQGAVQLFLQLHNISPSSGVCEDVINNALVSFDIHERELSHWRFTTLWHLSRDFYKDDNNKANKGTRTIDKCMFLIINSLRSENLRVREIAQQWLQHSVNFGDIGRILETILLVLLEPSTSRIAIHYVPLLKNKKEKNKTGRGSSITSVAKKGSSANNNKLEEIDEKIQSEDDDTREVTKSRTHSELSSGGFADDEDEELDDDMDELAESLNSLSNKKQETSTNSKNGKLNAQQRGGKTTPTHPLLIHKLLYTQRYDHQQCLHILSHIGSVLDNEGRAFICSAATTSMSVCNTPHQSLLRELLIRHRRALSGNQFYGSLADAHQLLIRASTAKYLEILLSVCLYFIRSDYQQEARASQADLEGNFTVQQASAKVLTQIAYLLLEIARDSGKGFSVYVNDLLSRSKIQRIALHCLLSTVYAVTGDYRESSEVGYYSMVEYPNLLETADLQNGKKRNHIDLQVSLLKFIESLIHLESCIGTDNPAHVNPTEKKSKRDKSGSIGKTPPFEYVAFKPIVSQPMFISASLTVLREKRWVHLHADWIKLLISCLPKFSNDMSKAIVPVVYQLCANLKTVTKIFKESYSGEREEESSVQIPPDYMLVLLNGLTSFCHYCLISTTTGGTLSSTAGRVSSKSKTSVDESSSLFSNLVQVFSNTSATPSKVTTSEEGSPALNETRDGLLGILPAIITAISSVWKVWDANKISTQNLPSKTPLAIGQTKAVRLAILQLITPIAMNHTVVFLASLADVWCLYRDCSFIKPHPNLHSKEWLHLSNKKYIPSITEDQSVLLEIIQAIKALTLDTVVDTSKQVLRQLIAMKERNQPVPLEVCMLQFLYELLSKGSDDLDSIKTTLMALLKDAHSLNMTPPALFILMAILNIYVQKIPVSEERRSRREIQDLVTKFLESLNAIAASSLEGSAWFRRSLQVVTQQDQSSDLEESTATTVSDKSSFPENLPPPTPNVVNSKTSQYSVPAILILAEYIAPMMDLVYVSEEKDKIASALVYLIYNIIPYLKNHSTQNNTGYRASSALLAAISDYQYTLRAWRKDVYELFLDSDFFQMDLLSFGFWRIIIDRLITYDNSVFKDLMQKIVLSQSGAINIFANREQEMEQRAQLLKRLSFVIFCGDLDQYHQYIPDIQERLAESIRQLQGPFLHEQVFLCFRLLLVRMSPNHLISFWPPILAELVLVFVHMEHELVNGGKPKNKTKVAVLESFLGINGYFKDPTKWLRLYLAVCKLLDFLLILPSESLPHYQVYKWAFTETPGVYCTPNLDEITDEELSDKPATESPKDKGHDSKVRSKKEQHNGGKVGKIEEVSKMAVLNSPISEQKRLASKEKLLKAKSRESIKHRHISAVFFPYITRIVRILQQKNLGEDSWHTPLRVPGELILLQKKIQSIYDLLPFFISVTGDLVKQDVDVTKFARFKMQLVEELIEKDFIEHSSSLT